MADLMSRMTAARPTDADLDASWSPTDREARLTTILAGQRRVRRARVSRLALIPAVAATLAAVAIVPHLLDSGNAAAADLHALARSAVKGDGAVPAPGTWLHTKSTSVQHNYWPHQGGATYSHSYETWRNFDGTLAVIDHNRLHSWTAWAMTTEHVTGSYQDPTPKFSATLPDTAAGLTDYLDSRVFGSSSHAEAMYSALTDLAGSRTLPPRTLAAAFEALAQVDHVSTADLAVGGNPAVEVSYDEALTSSTETYVFDRATGQPLSSQDQSDRGDDLSTTTLAETVDEVPADVLAAFAAHQNDVPYDNATGAVVPESKR